MSLKLVPKQRFCGQKIGQHLIVDAQEVYTIDYPFSELKVSSSLGAVASGIAELEIGWDPEKTIVNNASIDFIVKGDVPMFIPTPALEGKLYFNDNQVGYGGWAPWTSGSTVEGVVNILPWLQNWETTKRRNVVKAVATTSILTVPACTLTVNGRAVVTYQGEKPTIKPPPSPYDWLIPYLKWGAIGAGALTAIYLGVRFYEARKKK